MSDIISAIEDKRLFGSLFKNPETWRAWRIYLRALFNLPIEGRAERRLFKDCTGLAKPPASRVKESFVICGRRSGKSSISAIIASYLAAFHDWRPFLSLGEKGWIFVIANDKAQAGIIKGYISATFGQNRLLKNMVKKETVETIELKNQIVISVKTCDFRTLRGYTILCAILEEVAFWRSETSANPDKEILAAIRPALATIPESLLIGISTPYSRAGVLWETFKKHYGQAGGPLIWKAKTEIMNPTIDRGIIKQALADDPEAGRAEWEAKWRADISSFLPAEAVEACVIPGRRELPRVEGVEYFGYVDHSGGRQDSAALGVSFREKGGKVILACLRERIPPFRPDAVSEEFSETLKNYGIREIEADRYAGSWVTDSFHKFGIEVKACEKSASELYLEFGPKINQGSVELLDLKRLTAQLSSLERRIRSGGKDLITHYPGSHDDAANACAGACWMAAREEAGAALGVIGDVYPSGDDDFDPSIARMIRGLREGK
jgi:hypothetical protein